MCVDCIDANHFASLRGKPIRHYWQPIENVCYYGAFNCIYTSTVWTWHHNSKHASTFTRTNMTASIKLYNGNTHNEWLICNLSISIPLQYFVFSNVNKWQQKQTKFETNAHRSSNTIEMTEIIQRNWCSRASGILIQVYNITSISQNFYSELLRMIYAAPRISSLLFHILLRENRIGVSLFCVAEEMLPCMLSTCLLEKEKIGAVYNLLIQMFSEYCLQIEVPSKRKFIKPFQEFRIENTIKCSW